MTDLERAKKLIEEYFNREFGEDSSPDFTNLSKIPIAYTTTEDEEHEIQVYANLDDCIITKYVDGKWANADIYDDLDEMIEYGLDGLSFDELVCAISIDDVLEDAADRSEHGEGPCQDLER